MHTTTTGITGLMDFCRFCAILIALFAVVGLVRQNRAGSIKLDDRPEDYSDDLLPGYGDTKEKMDELDAA